MKYRYHIQILFGTTNRHIHAFNSNSEILKMSEIRAQIDTFKGKPTGGFSIESLIKTIND